MPSFLRHGLVTRHNCAGGLRQQLLGSFALEPSKRQRRLGALHGAGGLLQGRLEQAFFDPVERLAFLDEVTFLEQHRLQVALHPRPDLDPVDRFDAPDEIGRLRNRLALGVNGADRDHSRFGTLGVSKRRHQQDQNHD